MSLQDMAATPRPENPAQAPTGESKAPMRSWRKKFRKMKIMFDKAMEASNSLYREEQKATAIAKRLQEQNDQILDLLLDINDERYIQPHLRYYLRSPSPSSSAVPSLEPDSGPVPLSTLEKTLPHTRPTAEALQQHPELAVNHPLGYFDPSREEEYLNALDSTLADPTGYPTEDTSGRPIRSIDRPVITEKEISLRNPQSVTNWLRRNQPDVFLQDKYEERANAKASRQAAAETGGSSASHGRKRASLANAQQATAPKNDQDTLDDDIGFTEAPFGGRGKKNKDDEPYRPKGGSSRPAKRKRGEDSEGKGVKKKSKTNNVAQEDADG